MVSLTGLPRVRLASLPTPLEAAPRLSETLGGPAIWLKRDDLTGLAMGGNKARKLEFLMGEARESNARLVITAGGQQSNHCRMTAAAARKLGMRCLLLLTGEPPATAQGNLLLDMLFGAELQFVGDVGFLELDDLLKEVFERQRRDGKEPFLIPVGGAAAAGSAGYVSAVREISDQTKEMGLSPHYLFHATGSCGTQAGLTIGAKALETGLRVVGVSVRYDERTIRDRVKRIAGETTALLGMDLQIADEDFDVLDGYVGDGYAKPTAGCLEAVRLLALTEGLILDPTYTGKAMAALIDQVRNGKLGPGDDVIFLHTGGTPGVFASSETLCRACESSDL